MGIKSVTGFAFFVSVWLCNINICVPVPVFNLQNVSETPGKTELEIDSESIDRNSTRTTGPSATLSFLRRFGYLEPQDTNSSETLYSEERISEAIRLMQRFGALPETGKLDSATISLQTKPRCGVPDIVKSRSKRFALGSKGWNKRTLTYRVENWSPKLSQMEVSDDIRKALNVWADYAHLRFVNKSLHSDNVDIAISFARGYHGDSYPFDGAGGILAHAFYPQSEGQKGGLAGDIHFDSDENWFSPSSRSNISDRNQGISFLDVAVHELGHSLGLAHSHTPGSVMFPYYQTPDSEEPHLDYDDIMALYHLYITRQIDNGEEDHTESTSKRTHRPIASTTSETNNFPFSTELTDTVNPTSTEAPTHYTTSTYESEASEPSLCKDQWDTIAFIRNEIFVFIGEYMWRFTEKGHQSNGRYPAKSSRLFPILKGLKRIDAAFERESDGKIIFISGQSYWTFDGINEGNSGPHSLIDFGLPKSLERLDAAFVWGKNRMTYFFSDNLYWKYNETMNTIEDGYPKEISRWRGVPDSLTSVIRYKDDKTYFFKDNEYWKFDDYTVHTEEGYPMNTLRDWFNC